MRSKKNLKMISTQSGQKEHQSRRKDGVPAVRGKIAPQEKVLEIPQKQNA